MKDKDSQPPKTSN